MSSRRSGLSSQAPTRDPLTREVLLRNVRLALFGESEPTTVGPYEIRRRLGGGAMGSIFDSFDPRLRRSIALKLVDVATLPSTDAHVVTREARALAQLDDPNVVLVYDAGQCELGVWVAMELLAGEDLEAWLERTPDRSVADALRILRAVARGLVSVHAAGIVHRDVKPANVYLVENGGVKLIDFGLALSDTDATPSRSAARHNTSHLRDPQRSVSGTPAYMAPEQHRGARATAASDQYAWCVMAWESLYGVRPFAALELDGLYRRKTGDKLPMRPLREDVPRRIHVALRRGLSAEPGDRWSSMARLLEECASPSASTWLRVLALGLAAIAMAVVVWIASSTPEQAPCAEPGLWNQTQQQAVRAAVIGDDSELRRSTWARVAPRLGGQVDAYEATRSQTCDLLRAGTLDERVADQRFGCLRRWRASFGRLTQTLGEADDASMVGAIGWTLGLEDPRQCAEIDARRATKTPLPPNSQRAAVAQARIRLDVARAKHDLARHEEALQLLDELARSAPAREFAPLGAEVLHQRGRTLHEIGRWDEAESAYVDAFHQAQRVRHDFVAARSAVGMVLLAFAQADADKAESWLRRGRAAGHEPWLELTVTFEACEAFVLSLRGEHHRAVEVSLRSMELAESLPPSSLRMATVTDTVGRLNRVGRVAEAVELAKRDIAEREITLGPSHPWLAVSVGNLALSSWNVGDVETSFAAFERELELERAHRGEDALELAIGLLNYAGKLNALERWDEAAARLDVAAPIFDATLPASHPTLAITALTQGSTSLGQGLLEPALGHFERARVIGEQALGSDHTIVGWALVGTGAVLLERDPDEVADALEALKLGWDRVEPHLEHDVTGSSGWALLRLADATWRSGGSQRDAIAMAKRARHIADNPHPEARLIVEQVDAWLRLHPTPAAG